MATWDSYTQKSTPEDNDTLMIKDTAGAANKRTPFSGVWNWIVNKLTSAVISNLQTNNKSIIPAINELNSKTEDMLYQKGPITGIKDTAESIIIKSVGFYPINAAQTTDSPTPSSGFCIIYTHDASSGIVWTYHNNGAVYRARKYEGVLEDFTNVHSAIS